MTSYSLVESYHFRETCCLHLYHSSTLKMKGSSKILVPFYLTTQHQSLQESDLQHFQVFSGKSLTSALTMFHWTNYYYVFKFIQFMKCPIHEYSKKKKSDDPPLPNWLPKCAVMANT